MLLLTRTSLKMKNPGQLKAVCCIFRITLHLESLYARAS